MGESIVSRCWQSRVSEALASGSLDALPVGQDYLTLHTDIEEWKPVIRIVCNAPKTNDPISPPADTIVVCSSPKLLEQAKIEFLGKNPFEGILRAGKKNRIISHHTGQTGIIKQTELHDTVHKLTVQHEYATKKTTVQSTIVIHPDHQKDVTLLHLDTMHQCMASPVDRVIVLADQELTRSGLATMLKMANKKMEIIFVPSVPKEFRLFSKISE
jgi:hypothetical protein